MKESYIGWSGRGILLYEDLSLNEQLPCLEYLYVTRMLIGNRIYEYDDDALDYLRPILFKMCSNRPSYEGLSNIPKDKRAGNYLFESNLLILDRLL